MKRILSKKSLTQHKEPDVKEELKTIDTMQLTSDNILEKLLQPTANLQKKQSLQIRKYDPKFQKPDYQTLMEENLSVKQQLKTQQQTTTTLKFKLSEYERKIKFLQGIQEKWEKAEGQQQTKKQSVYTEILKKKIQQLNELYLSAQQKIKDMKRLPHVSVFDQVTVEKEYLLRETIRLKCIITSMTAAEQPQGNLQNKFLKLIKEDNEQLKAKIRLLQNDKNLLKSRQGIERIKMTNLAKQIQILKNKLTQKQAEIQKLNNENKNLLFKRVNQLKMEEQKKENEEVAKLKQLIDELREDQRRLEIEKDLLNSEYQKLKKNEKINESKLNNDDKQKNDLRAQNTRFRRIIEQLREQLQREKENFRLLQSQFRKKKKQKRQITTEQRIEHFPPVRYQDIELPLMILAALLKHSTLTQIAELIPKEDGEELRCGRLVEIFCEEPLRLQRTQALKLARYIVEDDRSNRIVYNEKAVVSRDLCITTIKAAVNKLLQCRNSKNQDTWRCLLARSKKLLPELEKMRGEVISKEALLGILGRHLNQSFGEYVTLLILQSFDLDASESEVMIKVDRSVQVLNRILSYQH